jgi:hypothetical protein
MLEDGDGKGHGPLHFVCSLTNYTICDFVQKQHANGRQKIFGPKDIDKMREETVPAIRIKQNTAAQITNFVRRWRGI